MPGTVKIWWHDGAVKDIRYHDLPVVAEPELAFEEVAVGAAAAASGPAPEGATVAIVETDVSFRYRVRPAGDATDASATQSKPVLAVSYMTEAIGVEAGATISFIEG